MTKKNPTPRPCKARLFRPDGSVRAFFRAESVEDAQRRARRILKKKALPLGWRLIVDGPAIAALAGTPTGEGRAIAAPTIDLPGIGTAPDPVSNFTTPFRVGDRVRRTEESPGCTPAGTLGRVIDTTDAEEGHRIRVKWDDRPAYWMGEDQIEPVREPKAHTEKSAKARLALVRQATGVPYSDQPDLVAAVRGIASQMDRHRQERDEARRMLAAAIEQSTELAGQFQDAFGLPGSSWPQLVSHARNARAARDLHRQLLGLPDEHGGTIEGAIRALQTDLETAKADLARAVADAMVAHGGAEHAEAERAAAESRTTNAFRDRDAAQARLLGAMQLAEKAEDIAWELLAVETLECLNKTWLANATSPAVQSRMVQERLRDQISLLEHIAGR